MFLINVTLPIVLIILFGYALAYGKVVTIEVAQHIGKYILWAAGPSIIFVSISNDPVTNLLEWRFWLAYLVSIAVVLIAAYLIFRYLLKISTISAIVAAFSSVIKNTIIMALPILINIVGHQAVLPVVISIIIFNCIVAPLFMFLGEIYCSRKNSKNPWKVLVIALYGTVKNPLVFSAILGLLCSVLQLRLPGSIATSLTMVGASFIPCALVAVGIELRFLKLEGNIVKAFMVTALNLVVCPSLAIVCAYVFKLPALYAVSLVILSAMPTAKSMYMYVSKFQEFNKETAVVISLTTIFSLFSIPFFIGLSYHLWPSVFTI